MCWEGSDYGAAEQRTNQQAQEQTILSGIQNIDQAFAGYDDNFYNRYRQSYINYQMPQLASQYQSAQKATTGGLADRGLLKSSAAEDAYSGLSKTLATSEQSIADEATSQALSLKTQVAQQKQTLVNQLLASTYPSTVANSALQTASTFTYPSAWEPLANQFTSDANAAKNVVSNETYQSLYV